MELKRLLSWYKRQHWLRFLVRGLPVDIDYFLEEQEKKLPSVDDNSNLLKVVSKINNSNQIGSRLQVVVSPNRNKRKFIAEAPLDINNLHKRSAKIASEFRAEFTNDTCAVVVDKPIWSDNPLSIRYHEMEYASVLAYRELGMYCGILSANVLLFSEDSNCLLLHRRSGSNYDFKNLLHTYGGAYIPTGSGHNVDRLGLKNTALREVFEESKTGIDLSNSTPSVIIDEFEIQFVQTAYLGVNISAEQVNEAASNWEGDPVALPFNELPEMLSNINLWAPAGWTHVILWLALDPPCLKDKNLLGGLSGKQLAELLVEKCLTSNSTGR